MSLHIIDLTESPLAKSISRPQHSSIAPNASCPRSVHQTANKRSRRNSTETQDVVLLKTINRTSEKTLRAVLNNLIIKHRGQAVSWLSAELLVPQEVVRPWKEGDDDVGDSKERVDEEKESEVEGDEADQSQRNEDNSQDTSRRDGNQAEANESTTSTAVGSSSKRERPSSQYATCVDCQAEFHVLSNEKGACRGHGGVLKKKSSSDTLVWDDWRESLYGEMDTMENRKEHPDGFEWTCCGLSGERRKCKIGRHKDWKPPVGQVDWKLPISETDAIGAFFRTKRFRSRYVKCVNCAEEFTTTSNEAGDCVWHEGYLERDWDSPTWDEWDEDCHGIIDCKRNRKLYPQGFIWTCCDKKGSGQRDGCKIGRHKEEDQALKKAKTCS